MQDKEWRRRFIIGLVVAAIFFGWWLRGFLYSNWRFQLFSRHSWSFVAHEFESGWMLSSKSDWIFLLTLLFAIPVFLYLWYLCAKVRWRKLIKKIWKAIVDLFNKIFKKQKKKKKSNKYAPPLPPALVVSTSSASGRPKPIGHATPVVTVTPQPLYGGSTGPVFTEKAYQPFDGGTTKDSSWKNDDFKGSLTEVPLENIELPQREAVVENVPALFENAGYQLIKDVKTSVQNLNFLAVGQNVVYAVLMDQEAGDWLAEEEPFNGEAPLWFSEVDHRVSPIYELKQSVAELKNKIGTQLPNMVVRGFMIEEKGNIINAEEMLRIWQEMDVIVSRTDIGGTEDLSVTADVVQETPPASAEDVATITKLVKEGSE